LTQSAKDALAVYHYPDMWDRPSAIALPLVHAVLANGYRHRPVETVPKLRLGRTTWGTGPPWTT
jgi:hypothetical protein